MFPAVRASQPPALPAPLRLGTPQLNYKQHAQLPLFWGSMMQPGLVVPVANAVAEVVSKCGMPSAPNLSGMHLYRYSPTGGKRCNFRDQSLIPPADSEPANRVTAVVPDFVEGPALNAAKQKLSSHVAKYYGCSIPGVGSELWKYRLKEVLESLPPEERDSVEKGHGQFFALTNGVTIFRWQLESNPKTLDLRLNSDSTRSFLRQVERYGEVTRALQHSPYRTLADGLQALHDHTVAQSIMLGVALTKEEPEAVYFTSAPGLAKGAFRENLAILGEQLKLIPIIYPMDRLLIRENGMGGKEIQSEPVDESATDQLVARSIALPYKPSGDPPSKL